MQIGILRNVGSSNLLILFFFNKFFLQVRLPALWYYIRKPREYKVLGGFAFIL